MALASPSVQRKWSLVFLSSALLGLLVQLSWLIIHRKSGWDYRVYEAAYLTFKEGFDPYLQSNMELHGSNMAFSYSPAVLPLLAPFANFGPWVFICFQLSIFSFLIWAASKFVEDRAGSIFIILTAFWSVGWNVVSGNAALIETFFLALATLSIGYNRPKTSAINIGLAAYVKGLPAFFLGVFPFLYSKKKGVVLIFLGLLVAFIPIAISFSLMPVHAANWLDFNLGNRPTQLAPIDEFFITHNSPGYFNILFTISHALFGASPIAKLFLILLYLASAGFFYFIFQKMRAAVQGDPRADLLLFCLGCIFLALLSPRFKPYGFATVLLPIVILVDPEKPKLKWLMGCLLCLLSPLSLLFNTPIKQIFGDGFIWNFINTSQTLALLLAVAWIVNLRIYRRIH